MLKNILIIIAVTLISVFCLAGCKKKSPEGTSSQESAAMAEYRAQAKAEITEENMEEELKRIEEAIERETAGQR